MNVQVQEEAAEWLVEFRTEEAGSSSRERFAAWLRTSPEHVRAYLELVAFWEDARLFDSGRALDVEALISLARSDTNVVELEAAVRPEGTPVVSARDPARSHRRSLWRQPWATVAAVLCLAVIAGFWYAGYYKPVYATEIGELRSVKLPDGSSVELNALSRVRVRFSDRERVVELLQGQALFRVAKNRTRPFIVVSDDTRVRAVGTQFDVNRKHAKTIVTVLEGRVALQSATRSVPEAGAVSHLPEPVELGAGEQVTVTASSPVAPKRADVVIATAWTQQQLIFESTPLPEAAEEFNRFNSQRLVIASGELADFRINGTFAALDPASLPRFVRFLREQPHIRIVESEDRIVVTAN